MAAESGKGFSMKLGIQCFFLLYFLCAGGVALATEKNCENPNPLRFALIPRTDLTKQMEKYRPLLQELERSLGRKITIVQASSYGSVIEGLIANTADLASMGPGSYAIARNRDASITPFATWTMQAGHFIKQGAHAYNSLLIVRRDSEFKRVGELRQRRLSLTDPASTSGGIVPRAEFSKLIKQPLEEFASGVTYSGSHDRSIETLKKGLVDGAFVASEHLDQAIRDGRIKPEEIRVLWESPPIPHDPFVYRGKLCPELKAKIRNVFFTDSPEIKAFLQNLKGERFVAVTDNEYRELREILLAEQK
jgi:phosphonate transport system substrate-binding protein